MSDTCRTDRLLRARSVLEKIGCGNSKFYQMLSSGEFPPGVRIGTRSVGWRESTVDEWIASRPVVDLRRQRKTPSSDHRAAPAS